MTGSRLYSLGEVTMAVLGMEERWQQAIPQKFP